LLLGSGCRWQQRTFGAGAAEAAAPGDTLRFDPLDLPQDREIVPAAHPPAAANRRSETVVVGPDAGAVDAADSAALRAADSTAALGGQVFKVQLFTSKLFAEARQARRVAEEIFDRPVTMDYEVPYFKVRVGAFPDRYQAESYAQRARTAGYPDAWVVAAAAAVRRAAPLYDETSRLPALGDSTGADTLPAGGGSPDGD